MFLCVCNKVREHETERRHLIGTQCGRCLDLIFIHRDGKGIWRMSDFNYTQDGVSVDWKYQPSEDRLYVKREVDKAVHDSIAEKAKQVRNSGGTREKDGFRLVATVPAEMFTLANDGRTFDGKYKGFLNCDKEMQQKMLSKFFLEPEIKIFLTNDNYKV